MKSGDVIFLFFYKPLVDEITFMVLVLKHRFSCTLFVEKEIRGFLHWKDIHTSPMGRIPYDSGVHSHNFVVRFMSLRITLTSNFKMFFIYSCMHCNNAALELHI